MLENSLTITPTQWGAIALVALWLAIAVGLAEWLYRHQIGGPEMGRKVVHIGTGHVLLLAWWLHIPAWIGMLASVAAAIFTLVSYRLPLLPSVNGIGRKSWGTFFYAISVGVVIALCWPADRPQYAALGILVMAWGDGMAALVGQRFGQHTYQWASITKSWEGTATMAVMSFVVAAAILFGTQGCSWTTGTIALSIALVAAGLEVFSKWGLDNLTVPLASSAIALLGDRLWLP
jgi:phytol kinase